MALLTVSLESTVLYVSRTTLKSSGKWRDFVSCSLVLPSAPSAKMPRRADTPRGENAWFVSLSMNPCEHNNMWI